MSNKPASMELKDYLIKKMSLKLGAPIPIIEVVIRHQFESAKEAVYNHNSIEISGFGKFLFNFGKAKKRLFFNNKKIPLFEEKLKTEGSVSKLETINRKLNTAIEEIGIIEKKLKLQGGTE